MIWLNISHPCILNGYLDLILFFDPMHCDYNYLYIPTNSHTYKITVYIYLNSPTCFSNKSCTQRDVNTRSNIYQIHIHNFKVMASVNIKIQITIDCVMST